MAQRAPRRRGASNAVAGGKNGPVVAENRRPQHHALAVEKALAVHVHHAFVTLAGEMGWRFKGKAVNMTGRLLGVGPATLERYIRQHAESGGVVEDPAPAGRPAWKLPLKQAASLIRSHLRKQRSSKVPATLSTLQEAVRDAVGLELHQATLKRYLARCGFKYGLSPKRRHVLHESIVNRAYRAKYLKRLNDWVADCVSNRRAQRTSLVCLDESYKHKNNDLLRGWYGTGENDYFETWDSKGQRHNIIGAIAYNSLQKIVTRREDKSKATYSYWRHTGGHLVEGSLRVWDGKAVKPAKTKAAKAVALGQSQGVKYAEGDYHGNMNANVFLSWFETLCRDLLVPAKYGSCLIKMDGAK